jgi:formate/nitrite transporter
MVSVAAGKMNASWIALFAKAIMCNFLVCLAVWMAYASKTVADKVLAVVFPITAFVACGFEHCVANMFFLPMGVLLASLGISPAGIDPSSVTMLGALYNWSATIPGNIIGGALFVGLMYWFIYKKNKR